ncbi:MAG: amidophosphoribosyltransferase, partial [Chitinophagales bacterium]
DFVAFRAMVELLEDNGKESMLQEVYEECKKQLNLPADKMQNAVKKLYDQFPYEAISKKVSEIVKSKNIRAEVEVIYQTVDKLHEAIPNHPGDWYFTGNYPTPGGNRVVNRAFMNFMEGKDVRAYD